jgi:phage antirepressor YoqD-like protein
VLYSPATASLKQRTEQDRSITILTAHGLGLKSQESEGKDFVEWIDATDPSQKEFRSMLFDLSRLRGQYPQFFREIRQQHSGGNVIEFLGDFDWLDGLNESGTLSKGTLIGFDGRRPSNGGANNIPTSDVTAGVSDATVSIATSGWTAPPTPTPYGGKSFVVLMSTFGSNVQQKTNQERLRTILAANGIVAVEVDGSMPENKELRNELFEISGIRGNFPQVFVEDDDFNYTYIGGLDKIEALNDCSAILSVLGHDEGQAIDQDDGRGSGREREYKMNVDEYENERLDNSDHGVPPSLASATSSNGWYDAADEMIQVEDGDNKTETKDETTKIATPPVGFQIVSDHAAGHGDLDADSQKEIKSDLSSGIFTPQVGLAVAAVAAGIAVWVSRGR